MFISAELDLTFLEELVELRDALGALKTNADRYIEESTNASSSLEKLNESLSLLRALNIYRRTPLGVPSTGDDTVEIGNDTGDREQS